MGSLLSAIFVPRDFWLLGPRDKIGGSIQEGSGSGDVEIGKGAVQIPWIRRGNTILPLLSNDEDDDDDDDFFNKEPKGVTSFN